MQAGYFFTEVSMSLLDQVRDYCAELEPKLTTMREDGIKFAVLGESDGDACLFNSLLATVWGDAQFNWPLIAVIMCQGPDGMFYRSPRRAACGNEGFGGTFFSRDMATGVMAAATLQGFPLVIWKNWLDYIGKSRPCLVKKPKWLGGGCAVRSPIYRYAPDDRSQITPPCWAMMGRVADYRGWARHGEMKRWEGTDGEIAILEAKNCVKGYELHLKAVDAYIKLLVNQSREFSQAVGEIAHERVPDNLFYEFLAKRTISNDFIQRFLDLAPPPRYKFGNAWVWEKFSVESHIDVTCGWDFLFLGKLILEFCG